MACNGMLAGLVAITAPCAFVSPNSAIIIGILAGALVCGGVLFNERVIKVDDPCGAISVHGYCGWLGGVCVGIFADGTYGAGWNGVGATTYLGKAGQGVTGLLHGDVTQFFTQFGGATLMAVYAFGFTYVVFKIVNAFFPLRVSAEVEKEGLDVPEFGMPAYHEGALNDGGMLGLPACSGGHAEHAVEAVIQPFKLGNQRWPSASNVKGIPLLIVSPGSGTQKGIREVYRGMEYQVDFLPKVKIEIVTSDDKVQAVIETIIKNARTGRIGDGKIFVYPVAEVIRIRTGETGDEAV